MGPDALVAVDAQDPLWLVDQITREWDRGNAVIPMNHRWTGHETRQVLDRFRPAVLRTKEGQTRLKTPSLVEPGIGLVMATSGTTGAPKGVELSRTAIEAAMRSGTSRLGQTAQDRWLVFLPAAHVAGLRTALSRWAGAGPQITLPSFDPELIAAAEGATMMSMVPLQLNICLDAGVDLTRFKAILVGGGVIPAALRDRARDAGAPVVTTYGMTETFGGCVYDHVPLEGCTVAVDEAGTIILSGPMLFDRYRLDPHATAAALRDGRFMTGDVGSFEGGRLEVLGRWDDMIVTAGNNVAPAEVESVLAEHPMVRDCAVIGVADRRLGQAVCAFVVAAGSTTEEIARWCSQQLAKHKLPKHIVMVDRIPRSETTKIDKHQLSVIATRKLGMKEGHPITTEGSIMGATDKVDAKLDQAKGEFKQKAGEITDDRSTQLEGQMQEAKGDLKEGWEKTKDAVKDATDR